MNVHGRRVRRGLLLAAAALVSSCSGGSGGSDPDLPPAPTAAPATTAASDATAEGGVVGDDVDDAPVADGLVVAMSVTADGLDETVSVTLDPDDAGGVDPFGRFATCSGHRSSFGVYGVLVSQDSGPIEAASVLTIERVDGPGEHAAELRVERRAFAPIVATGSLTIADDFRSGSFTGSDDAGEPVVASFDCTGAGVTPAPLVQGADDGVVETVEVFVLLSRDDAGRVVGLAVDASEADVECPAAAGVDRPLLVRVDGDATIGAITTFELSDGAGAAMRLRVGGVSYEFDDVFVTVEGDRTAASFDAETADGLVAIGAFSCT